MADPRGYTPKHLADLVFDRRSALEGERKQVTVLFADVARSLELAERLDPEEWHLVLDRYFRVLTEGIHRFEGTVNQYTGDGVMALFGAPLAQEDHAQRAVAAALSLRGELALLAGELEREHGIAFGVRIGLNSGEVVVGRIGDDLRMDYTAQGRVVGVAERIQQLAEPSDVLLAGSTAALVAGYFELDALGPTRLRGLETPVAVYRLRGGGPLRTRLEASRARGFSRFVGRVGEMAALVERFEQARRGAGCVVGVVGEAGVGKSRLCREFTSLCAASGAELGETHGSAHARNLPLVPVLALLRAQLGIAAGEADDALRARVAHALGELDPALADEGALLCEFLGLAPERGRAPAPLDPGDRQRALFDLLHRMLIARSRLRPAVYLIEDLQWLDAASEQFVERLARACAGTRTLLMVNLRPGYRAPWMLEPGYHELPLASLGADDVTLLLRDLLGPGLATSSLADRIRERSRGNPFFIEEIIHSLVQTGHLRGARGARELCGDADQIAIPATLHALLAARIDRLSEADKQLLELAAVIGPSFARALLASVAGREPDAVDASLRLLVGAELLREGEAGAGYAFRHPLIHEVAYATQLSSRRRRAHAAVASALESAEPARAPETAAQIAEHWAHGGDALRAVGWHKRAARWAAARDPEAAVHAWRRIRELLSGVTATPETASLGLRACTEILLVAGWRTGISEAESAALFAEGTRLADVCGDAKARVRLVEAYGAARGFSGDLPEMLTHVSAAARLAEAAGDPILKVGLSNRLVFANVHVGNLREAEALVDASLAAMPSGTGSGLAVFEVGPAAMKGMLLGATGHIAQGCEFLARAARLAEQVPEHVPVKPLVYLFSTMLAWMGGDSKAAERNADAFVRHASRTRSAWEQVLAQLCQGQAELLAGRPAAPALEQGLRIAREHRVGLEGEADLLAFLAEAHLDAGDVWRGLASAAEATRVAQERGCRWWEIRALRAEARALIHKDGALHESQVRAKLERAFALVDETGAVCEEPFLRQQLAALAYACGDADAAADELDAAAAGFRACGASARAAALRGAPPL
jgi:class 3 adenylate cyclase